MMDISVELLQWFINSQIKKSSDSGIKNESELAEELHKPIIKNFEKRKVHSSFADNIRGADFADMRLKSKLRGEFVFHYMLLIQ